MRQLLKAASAAYIGDKQLAAEGPKEQETDASIGELMMKSANEVQLRNMMLRQNSSDNQDAQLPRAKLDRRRHSQEQINEREQL